MRQFRLKSFVVLLLLPALALVAMPPPPARAQAIRVIVDGARVSFDQPPASIGGRVLVPLRGVFERLGAFVQWDPQTNSILASRGGRQVELSIGRRQAVVDGRPVLLDVPPMIVRGRTLVPLRFVSEAMGASVDWDVATRTVYITSGTGAQPAPALRPTVPAPDPGGRPIVEIAGVVSRVDAQASPPRILVQRDNLLYTFIITPETAITRVDPVTGQGGSIGLEQVRAGDFVRVTHTGGRAIAIRITAREVAGQIDAITSRVIVLSDGQTYAITEETRFFINDREVAREQLRAGMTVTVRLNPQTNQVMEVRARGVLVQPPTPTPGTVGAAVRIASFAHNVQSGLRAGEIVTATLRGTPGGVATFDIFGVATDIPMREVSPGVYQGTYTVKSGDNVVNAAIFGSLRIGNQSAPLVQAGSPVTIDTLPPVIVRRFPNEGETVTNARPNILITFHDRGGSGVARVRLMVEGQDVTARATVSETAVAYNPPEPLNGQVRVNIRLEDRAGNVAQDGYAFRIAVPQASMIRSVTIHPSTVLKPGDVLSVQVAGEPHVAACFIIEGLTQCIPMAEAGNQPGVYFGSYTVKQGDVAQNARVIVQFSKGDSTSRAEASARVNIQPTTAVAQPTITSPPQGSRVGSPIVVRGRATPGHQVVVRIDYKGTVVVFSVQGTYGEVSATANAAGDWSVTINQSAIVPGAELTIRAVAVDSFGRRSEPTVITVTQG